MLNSNAVMAHDNVSESSLAKLEEAMEQELFPQYVQSLSKYHTYRKLEASDSIRLLHLYPGVADDPIKGSLDHISFSKEPKYEALSYCWGALGSHYPIDIDRGTHLITASLAAALIRLRLADRVRVLWVDALCINQEDNNEKCKQIGLMRRIYTSASRVLVYLGPESFSSNLALELIEKIGKMNFSSVQSKTLSLISIARLGLPRTGSKTWMALVKFWCRPWFRRVWIVQEFLLGREVTFICGQWEGDWTVFMEATPKICDFAMVYVAQNTLVDFFARAQTQASEQANANTGLLAMLILCGLRTEADPRLNFKFTVKKYLEMDETILEEEENLGIPNFRSIMTMLRQDPGMSQEFSKAIEDNLGIPSFRRTMAVLRQYPGVSQQFSRALEYLLVDEYHGVPSNSTGLVLNREIPGYSLQSLIDRTRAAQATIPRDRLFALLGLTNDLDDEEKQHLKPDYNEELDWKIFRRYASVLINKGQYMEILCRSAPKSMDPKIPSWICGWLTHIPTLTTETVTLGTVDSGIYKAGGNSTTSLRLGNSEDLLVISGGLVDTIECVVASSVFGTSPDFWQAPEASSRTLDEIDLIFSGLSLYPTGESLFEVKWRTLIANKVAIGNTEAPTEFGEQYQKLRENIYSISTTFAQEEMSDSTPKRYAMALSVLGFYKICRTRGGYVGLVPLYSENGDRISIFKGGRVPFVLRPSNQQEGKFQLIGGCYIHGLMKGEAFQLPNWADVDIHLH